MHRCQADAPADGVGDTVALHGREAAGPVVALGGVAVVTATLLAAGGLRFGPAGLGTVLVAGPVSVAGAAVALRPAVASCSVRRAAMGALTQVTVAGVVWLAARS